ncbi:MAG: fatty acid desaturase family protein [Bdellovibrionota bacterium]
MKRHYTDPAGPVVSHQADQWKRFAHEINEIGREIRTSSGAEDFRQLRKMERWGRIASVLGYATAWILPNPASAFLISLGNFTRWALVFHPISHGALDRTEDVPKRYTSEGFAQGARRFIDWFDWITPNNWHHEHNKLHHYFLGTEKDPDIVGRNSAFIRNLRWPLAARYALSMLIACIWKPFYYAPNTLAEARHWRGDSTTNRICADNWNPLKPLGRELWLTCLLPYAIARFVVIPCLFLPLGRWAAISVLANSMFAEVFTNLHSFATIAPNHTGDDVATFSEPAKGRADHYLRQILGTVNFPAAGDLGDFLYGGMNYQIEHHLWPEASLLQCQRARPRLKEICARYDVNYREVPLLPRLWLTIRMMAGSCPMLELPSGRIQ